MSIDIMALSPNKQIFDFMFEIKNTELTQVADVYNTPISTLRETAEEALKGAKMKTGACNTVLDFLIVDTLNKNKVYNTISLAIKANILASAIYLVNVEHKGDYV